MKYFTKSLLLTALALLCIVLPARAQQAEFTSLDQVMDWMTTYYQNPEPGKLPQAVHFVCRNALPYDTFPQAMMTFAASAMDQSPNVIAQTAHAAFAERDNRSSLALTAFWLMKNPKGMDMIKYAQQVGVPDADLFLEYEAPDLLTQPVAATFDLDMLWAMFFATGAPEPVLHIADALLLQNGETPEERAVGASAHWTLVSNILIHPRVAEILIQAVDTTSDATLKQMMSKVLDDAVASRENAQ